MRPYVRRRLPLRSQIPPIFPLLRTFATGSIIKNIAAQDKRVRYISFRKNMGKALALQTGFKNAHGAIIITMDADLQDDPAEIPRFIAKINEGYDVVSGWKQHRLDPLEKRLPSKLFNKTIAFFSGIPLHDFNCGFKAYIREVCEYINIYGELHRLIPIIAYRKGFRIAEITVHHQKRLHGSSKYGFKRYFRGFFDAITVSFLNKYGERPLHFWGGVGFVLFTAGFITALYLSVLWIQGASIGQRPLLVLSLLLMILGVQFFSVGLLGEMIVDSFFRIRWTEHHVKEKI
jgi:glycosyltransferase involved in cell wall biosynthesis